jgi:riboflavin kinase/FMN adenylyltransferase
MKPAFVHISGSDALPERLRGGVVAIGNFDGVHRGHRSVLDRALEEAGKLGVPALVLTFEPHPRKLFQPDQPLFRLTPPSLKARLIEACGFDAMVEQCFDREFAGLTAEEFVSEILVGRLGIRHAVTGFDFHFGKARGGGPAYLMEAGGRHGFGVTLVDPFRDEGGEIVSSSRIRERLASGDVEEAAGLLGHRFAVEGEVIGGRKLGRTLGYPTANMALSDDVRLAHGIYAVRFRRADGSLHDGVASFGRRPTVTSDGAPLLETFVFDFSGDLYGETCRVSFFSFLRGEEKFEGLDALVEQMKRDEEEARAFMASAAPIGELDQALSFSAPTG